MQGNRPEAYKSRSKEIRAAIQSRGMDEFIHEELFVGGNMTQETLLQIGRLGLAIEDGANMVLDMYRVKEELTGADLFKGEPSEDRSHYAGYTELYKLPGMKDIADDAAEYIKSRLGEVIDEHCKSLEACISALGNTVTAKADKPDRKAKTPS